jgi:hypothetical protein
MTFSFVGYPTVVGPQAARKDKRSAFPLKRGALFQQVFWRAERGHWQKGSGAGFGFWNWHFFLGSKYGDLSRILQKGSERLRLHFFLKWSFGAAERFKRGSTARAIAPATRRSQTR